MRKGRKRWYLLGVLEADIMRLFLCQFIFPAGQEDAQYVLGPEPEPGGSRGPSADDQGIFP